MKLEHKTIKYIAYGLILVFFIVLISQNNNKELFEGLENKTTTEDEKAENIITNGVVKALDQEKTSSSVEHSSLMNIGTGRYIKLDEKYRNKPVLSPDTINITNTQYEAAINNLKKGLGLDGTNNKEQRDKLIETLDKMSDHIKLLGLNLINGNLDNIIDGDVTQFMKFYMTNYGDSMKVITDLKNYLENYTNEPSISVKLFGK